MGNYSGDIQGNITPQAEVLGVRAKRNPEPPATKPIDTNESTNTNEGVVMGEVTEPLTSPSVLEQQGIEMNRNSINSTPEYSTEKGEVLGETIEELLSPSELEEQGIERAKNLNE